MNVWQFLSSALWPCVALIAILVFQAPIRSLIARIERAKLWGGAEFDVSKLEEAKVESVVSLAREPRSEVHIETPLANQLEGDSGTPAYTTLASISPTALVMESWRKVELALASLLDAVAQQEGRVNLVHAQKAPNQVLASLRKSESIPRPTLELLDELRRLRNKVTHSSATPTEAEALTYAESASLLIEMLLSTQRFIAQKH